MMDQFVRTKEDVMLEQIAESLVAILEELRLANRREQDRDQRREAERARTREQYARL
jgi:hypothetical protein